MDVRLTEMILTPQSLFVSKVCEAGSGVVMNSISVSGDIILSNFVAILIVEELLKLLVVDQYSTRFYKCSRRRKLLRQRILETDTTVIICLLKNVPQFQYHIRIALSYYLQLVDLHPEKGGDGARASS